MRKVYKCRSANPIPTGEGRLSPPITTGTTNVFHLSASLYSTWYIQLRLSHLMLGYIHPYYIVMGMDANMKVCMHSQVWNLIIGCCISIQSTKLMFCSSHIFVFCFLFIFQWIFIWVLKLFRSIKISSDTGSNVGFLVCCCYDCGSLLFFVFWLL